MPFLCVTALAAWMLATPRRVVLGGESGNRLGPRTHVARERPEVSMAGLGHEQGGRDAVLAEMGQRTVAELMQCPLPSRCFTEQRPRPLVGQPPSAVGDSIELGPERCWADPWSQRAALGGGRPSSEGGAGPSPRPTR